MHLTELRPVPGSKHTKKRVGRGYASGHGQTSGRGNKGQKARAGGGVKPYFAGGQIPIVKALPFKRGFVNIFRVEYSVVNLDAIAEKFDAQSEVTPEKLVAAGLVKSSSQPVKILGSGEIDKPLKVMAHKFSAAAKQKIENAGGQVEEIGNATGGA
jgi:large subunit ribosomal protein L15